MSKMFALIALVSLALLFGCAGSGVPQEKYDELSASCSRAKSDASSALSAETAKTSSATARLSACIGEKQSLESLVEVRERENGALRAEEAVLAKARAKMDLAAQYNATAGYYLDAFGPGKVPNTARIRKIDEQATLLHDSALSALWQDVKACQGITGCDTAKAKMVPYIEGRATALMLEAAAIVGTAAN